MKKFVFLIVSLVLCLGSCTAQTSSNSQSVVGPELTKFLTNSKKPAVLKFYADWCSSCKELQPSYKKVSNIYSSKVDFYEIDIDKKANKALIKELKISRIPETIFVNQARTSLNCKLGVMPEADFSKRIELILVR